MSVQNIAGRLMKSIGNEFGVFGLIGNIGAESNFSPINAQNSGNKKLNMTDEAYTRAVDIGSYTNFVKDNIGYGLCQWTYHTRKQALYDLAQSKGVSIGDEDMQIDFIILELNSGYKSVLKKLKNAKSIREASDAFMVGYEGPADQSENAKQNRAAIGEKWYKELKGSEVTMAKKSRAAVVNLVNSWEGKKESDGSFKEIIDIYNGYKGTFPRGTKMQYDWAWCAATWSALAIKLGYTDIMPIEISCYYLIEAAKKMGIWVEKDSYVPKPADAVLYDWQDSGSGDNTGTPDHVGTVIEVNEAAGKFVVMEGNYSNAVKKRTMSINGRYIRGFITPKYDEDGVFNAQPVAGKSIETVAREVIAGTWGNGDERKQKIEDAGYDYSKVQAKVNEILNGSAVTPNKQSTSQVVSSKSVVASDKAQKYDKSLAGEYKVTASALYLRHGAGTNNKAMAKLPKGTKVRNYGYYTAVGKVKWLYIQVVMDGVTYTGFSSGEYLKKV